MTSCSKVYDPHIATAEKVLVVDGRITNKTDAYHVVLSYARSFTSSEKSTPSIGANVYVTDDLNNSFKFNERDKGDYVSDSLQFTSQPGHIYRPVSYTHLRAHETVLDLVCRLLLEKKK